ncbi:alkyl hydroperoxide reductase subunit F [Herbaspirillum sp. NPDC087042]|uniref:alkyl hydroperoxide reductase subunit F n=1 Tax=Herbaspirillum sp. NPDC087042 TaxID=3364004 RepID=UPI0037FD37C2
MLDANLKTQLKAYLEKVSHPIEIVASLDDGAKSREMQELLQDIVLLSDRIKLVEQRDSAANARTPSFTLNRPGTDISVEFAAIPMGHEFTSLVLALLQVGGHPVKLDDKVIEQIKNLDGDYSFETYVSLTCQNCPEVVQALNVMSIINPRIRSVTIDGALFQGEVEQRQIMAVPTVYMNGEVFGQGRTGVEEILAKLDTGAAARKGEELSTKEPYDVLIVGGGPAGAAAAIYAARKGIRTGVVAERFGGQVLDTMAIENFVSVKETDGPHCDGPLFKGKRVSVIGGGNSGVEAAIDLAGIVAHVTLIEFAAELKADAVLVRKLKSLPNVTVVTSAQTTEITGDGQRVNGISYKERDTGEIRHVELEGVFVQIGLVPNTEWLKGTLALSKHGEIEIDARGQTSIPGVFAAGDVTTVPYKQIVIAVGAGATAALSAFDHLIRSSVDEVSPAASQEAVAA